jgi:hypothetical protein
MDEKCRIAVVCTGAKSSTYPIPENEEYEHNIWQDAMATKWKDGNLRVRKTHPTACSLPVSRSVFPARRLS